MRHLLLSVMIYGGIFSGLYGMREVLPEERERGMSAWTRLNIFYNFYTILRGIGVSDFEKTVRLQKRTMQELLEQHIISESEEKHLYLGSCICNKSHSSIEYVVACSIMHNICKQKRMTLPKKITDLHTLLSYPALNALPDLKQQMHTCLAEHIISFYKTAGDSLLSVVAALPPSLHGLVASTLQTHVKSDIAQVARYLYSCSDEYIPPCVWLDKTYPTVHENVQELGRWINNLSVKDSYGSETFEVNPYLGVRVASQQGAWMPLLYGRFFSWAHRLNSTFFKNSALCAALVDQLLKTTPGQFNAHCSWLEIYLGDAPAKSPLATTLYEAILEKIDTPTKVALTGIPTKNIRTLLEGYLCMKYGHHTVGLVKYIHRTKPFEQAIEEEVCGTYHYKAEVLYRMFVGLKKDQRKNTVPKKLTMTVPHKLEAGLPKC